MTGAIPAEEMAPFVSAAIAVPTQATLIVSADQVAVPWPKVGSSN